MIVTYVAPRARPRAPEPARIAVSDSWTFSNLQRNTMQTGGAPPADCEGDSKETKLAKERIRQEWGHKTRQTMCVLALLGVFALCSTIVMAIVHVNNSVSHLASALSDPASFLLNHSMAITEDVAGTLESVEAMSNDAELVTNEAVPSMLLMMNETAAMVAQLAHLLKKPKIGISLEEQ